jgi:D-3-phosphoglycerate dehydrogenase / 2-oxoglutarate reductase
VGVDNIDLAAATKNGTLVMNTPGGNTRAAAELTMSLLMSLLRQVPSAHASMKAGRWDRKSFTGTEMKGKTLGIVGVGSIGQQVASWATALGMTAVGFGESSFIRCLA